MARCVKEVTADTFDAEVLQYSGLVLVDFYTEWCPPCKQVAPILEEFCVEQNTTLKIVKIDAADNASVANRIHAVPTFQLFRDGNKIGQTSGYQSKSQFIRWVDSV